MRIDSGVKWNRVICLVHIQRLSDAGKDIQIILVSDFPHLVICKVAIVLYTD